ncbi:FKBP-type peptidyl-prolyl cis-trans isomerase [Granulosicoccus antarcticus]|uniref:Peptidyl-prolyl cis-trans isomerase n=1 Tax=Granulosicoccus antarcticus IMCC3135 TaxID=1192854 RepID=A0A2Z2P033_9GAMM|nr:FKBP-type peptidyl-prolyl cis-trans isomerase [Granulosicoccus antarcticus]ASJ75398.1 FKBP-type 22 kDa peptidyl-prolyl cis-trans isomerase [Granulosicoccus antarcticus IMCC3135]
MKRTLLASATAAILTGALASSAIAQDTTLETPESKISYGLGMMIGERVLQQYGELDYDLLMQGMKAQKAGEETLITMEEAQMALQAQQEEVAAAAAAVAQEKGDGFLAENKAKEGVAVTDSGLQYEVITEGDGAKPTADDTVSVHYVGTLMDGTEFDSSIARGEPASFPLKGVIPGWTEGLQLMNVGSKYRFVIPSDLAYGERGAGQAIGPGETLVFEVELLEIKS